MWHRLKKSNKTRNRTDGQKSGEQKVHTSSDKTSLSKRHADENERMQELKSVLFSPPEQDLPQTSEIF